MHVPGSSLRSLGRRRKGVMIYSDSRACVPVLMFVAYVSDVCVCVCVNADKIRFQSVITLHEGWGGRGVQGR